MSAELNEHLESSTQWFIVWPKKSVHKKYVKKLMKGCENKFCPARGSCRHSLGTHFHASDCGTTYGDERLCKPCKPLFNWFNRFLMWIIK